ncbi:DUF547 domain-containing protein [Marinoscillum sp. MHG1-6]|uniref:DUF547 domain-containing protein n=1 Tax=Marinoscillum sp. MHG1-6 TaxID=2959627 RepID=UPI0021585076|nr:DUF547 domain-containing protein [Marinoscillum sp. MHG1-6]
MKWLFIVGFMLSVTISPAQSFFEQADVFFTKYVDDGQVNYQLLKREPKMLNDLVREIRDHDISNKRVTQDYLKAFYINAYNILVIKQVVDRYPVSGPLTIDGFFSDFKHGVMGQEVTLDQLEKDLLYSRFPDPRLHFVLVCAAKGCPPLADFGYIPSSLEKMLTERTSYVLNLNWFIRVNTGKVQVSEIFNWYKDDFIKSKGSVISFINQYRKDKINERSKVDYYTYDWSLNE